MIHYPFPLYITYTLLCPAVVNAKLYTIPRIFNGVCTIGEIANLNGEEKLR